MDRYGSDGSFEAALQIDLVQNRRVGARVAGQLSRAIHGQHTDGVRPRSGRAAPGAAGCPVALLCPGRARMVCLMAVTPPPDHGYLVQALRAAADEVEQQLSLSSGLTPGNVAILMHLAVHQPSTIPDVATAVGHGYHWAQTGLAGLRGSGWVIRWPSNPARFALTDAGTKLAHDMNAAVQRTIISAHGRPAALITGKVLDLLSDPVEEAARVEVPTATTTLSNVVAAAQCIGVEPHVIEAWVRSGSLPAPPWTEDHLHTMAGLRGSVAAVWPDLLDGARAGHKFASMTNRLGLTTQKVASAIWRDPLLRTQLDDALMQGRDPGIRHGRRLAYREGCWCPECRKAQLGR